ncbi:MAG: Rieske 2Fe-2S domain-containing protein [Chitinophagaceae bacterium]
MNEQEYTWHKIAGHINELNFASTNIAIAEMMGKKICIAKFKEQFFAFAFKCPHAGGIMADGHIDALGNVVCPVHRYKYNLQNGFNISGEGYYLKHWPVKLQKDGVYVGTEERDGFINLFQ